MIWEKKKERQAESKKESQSERKSDDFIRLGRISTGEPVGFSLSSPASIAIAGMTRSGKSAGTYSLLARLAALAPRVKISAVDITSVLARPLVEHPVGGDFALGTAEPVAAVEVVEKVRDEMRTRVGDLWNRKTDKITAFTSDYPLIMLVVEELPGTVEWLQDDDAAAGRKAGERLAPRFIAALRVILAEGLKVGVCVLVLAQRLDASVISGPARANLAIRIGLRVDDASGAAMLFPGISTEEAETLAVAAPGRGLITAPGYRMERVALDYLDYAAYLDELGVIRGQAP